MATKPVPISELTINLDGRIVRATALSESALLFLERELKPYCEIYAVTPPYNVMALLLTRFHPDDVVRYIREAFEEQ